MTIEREISVAADAEAAARFASYDTQDIWQKDKIGRAHV